MNKDRPDLKALQLEDTACARPRVWHFRKAGRRPVWTDDKKPRGSIIVNFKCPLGWVTGCTDVYSNITLDFSVTVFSDEINMLISGL